MSQLRRFDSVLKLFLVFPTQQGYQQPPAPANPYPPPSYSSGQQVFSQNG
uniref:Uncharacterized protein n=1 Tax=Magallana gigas TaxID=29159 RepID=K1QD49_MAGGI